MQNTVTYAEFGDTCLAALLSKCMRMQRSRAHSRPGSRVTRHGLAEPVSANSAPVPSLSKPAPPLSADFRRPLHTFTFDFKIQISYARECELSAASNVCAFAQSIL